MANTLTNLIPAAYEALDIVSRELVGLIPSVNRSANSDRVAKNQTLFVPVAPANTTATITPAMVVTAAADQTIGTKSVVIDNYKVSSFGYTGEEEYSLSTGPGTAPLIRDQIAQCFRIHTNEIEATIFAAMRIAASRATGTAGTTPFATNLSDTAQLKKILDDNGAPFADRSVVLDTTAGAALRTLSQLTKANEAGTAMTLRDGELLNLHGFSVKESAQIATFTAGTGASYLLNGALSAGETEITVDGGSGTILAGDVVAIGSNKYVVATALASNVFTISEPGLKIAAADNAAVTVSASHTKNFGFSRDAVILACRLPKVGANDLATDRQVVLDPRSGLAFELAIYPGYRMSKVEIAVAYGVSVIKPAHIGVLLG